MKTCFKCGEAKPLDDFYTHPRMADGHLGKCKSCAKLDVVENYAKRREQYSAYEHQRRQQPERKASQAAASQRHKERHPERAAARNAVARALRAGSLERQPCSVCGTAGGVQAHHMDYSRPLDVEWLCFEHHREHGHGQVVTALSHPAPQRREGNAT